MSTHTDNAAGLQLPLAPGLWRVDTDHSSVSFAIRHLGLAKVRGRFNRFEASLEVGPTLASTRLEASIATASIDTGNADRDGHLRSPDFFDVETYPEMTFVSTKITGAGEDWKVEGLATILDRTRPFTLDIEFGGLADFRGDRHAGFGAEGKLRRKDFGLDFGLPPATAALLGDVVSFALDVELVEPR